MTKHIFSPLDPPVRPNHGRDDAGYDSEEEERDLHHQDMYMNVRSDGRKSHDRAGSFTGSQGAWRPGTVGATVGCNGKREI